MIVPYIGTVRPGSLIQPTGELMRHPCFTVNPLPQDTGHVPPLFWEPPTEALTYDFMYDLDALGHVLAKVALGRLLYPLQITSRGQLNMFDLQGDLQGISPYAVMVFGSDGPLSGGSFSAEYSVDMQNWNSGALVSLFLDFCDRYTFTAQVLALEHASEAKPVDFNYLVPALMQQAHLLQWQVWDGGGSKDAPTNASSLFQQMRAVANHPTTEGRYPSTARHGMTATEIDDAGFSLIGFSESPI